MGRELRKPVSYDHDFHRWSFEQARLLRSGQAAAADLVNIAEELETLGRSEAAALRSSLRLLCYGVRIVGAAEVVETQAIRLAQVLSHGPEQLVPASRWKRRIV